MTFGGSLAGTLAALMRVRYPHLVDMAWASSSPLLGYPELADQFAWRKVLALALPDGAQPKQFALVRGELEGRIGRHAKGDNGFGYDPYFSPISDLSRTTAEMTPAEKNDISHRAAAVRALAPLMSELLSRHSD